MVQVNLEARSLKKYKKKKLKNNAGHNIAHDRRSMWKSPLYHNKSWVVLFWEPSVNALPSHHIGLPLSLDPFPIPQPSIRSYCHFSIICPLSVSLSLLSDILVSFLCLHSSFLTTPDFLVSIFLLNCCCCGEIKILPISLTKWKGRGWRIACTWVREVRGRRQQE